MFDYTKKQIGLFLTAFLFLLLLGLAFVYVDSNRAKDIQTVSQAQVLAGSLENYYHRYNAYPEIKEISVEQVKILTENGVNQNGNIVYYRSIADWPRPVTIVSSEENYLIKFSLKNSWPIWQLDNFFGGSCRLTNNVVLNCGQ